MMQFGRTKAAAVALLLLAGSAHSAVAACQGAAGFNAWLAAFRKEAAAQGISAATIASALDGLAYDQSIVDRDRKQGVFSQTFLEFSGRMVAPYRLQGGAQMLKKYAPVFAKIEQRFGVPGPVIVAFWGLETDFGANMGDFPTLRALATLAYDCRRPEKFRPQLMDVLRVIDRGDLTADEMIGAWAGEIGQLQFLPSDYYESAVDFDGNGHRDLRHSVPDVLASGANLLAKAGWRKGEPWIQEVRVPPDLAWDQADIAIQYPRSQWAKWGVTLPGGKPLPADKLQASLILPMGRNGPAFLAFANFRNAYLKWNESLVYSLTAAYFATRLAGAPPVSRGNGTVASFGFKQVLELQRLLAKRGYDVGLIDGKLGASTRAAVKAVQIKLGLPADSYPTPELVARLKGS